TPVHAASDNSAVSPNDSDTTPVVQQTDATGNADPTTASSDNGGNQQAMESPGSSSEMLFFDADSAVVTNANGEKLAAISKRLMQDPHAIALIEGHTDNSGVEAYNLDLSTQRAMAVRNLLIHRYNVSPVRVSTIGAGSSAPLTSNLTPSGRASNRRVEIRIVRPQLSTP
ncbi:MAG TPA: OmpA family protein, partial [Terriglobales bacterium]|nr:OmpA family protein [Terriglobales bacterium]